MFDVTVSGFLAGGFFQGVLFQVLRIKPGNIDFISLVYLNFYFQFLCRLLWLFTCGVNLHYLRSNHKTALSTPARMV